MSIILTLEIESIGHLGIGIGRHQGKVVMVPYTAPGDRVEVTLNRHHQSYDEASLVRIIAPSASRHDPPCSLFGRCGGCHLQHLDDAYQAKLKADLFRQQVTRSGAVSPGVIRPLLAADKPLQYRSRLEIHVSRTGGHGLGFMNRRSRTIVPTAACLLALPALEQLLGSLPSFLTQAAIPAITMADIACADSGEETDVTLVTAVPLADDERSRLIRSVRSVPFLTSLSLSTARGGPAAPLWTKPGQPPGVTYFLSIPNHSEPLTLSVWPGVFRQVNPAANRLLVGQVAEWLQAGPADQRVLDLYAGMGNLALPASFFAAEVVAVEVNSRAVENGRSNAAALGRHSVRWIQSSCTKALKGLLQQRSFFNTVILDPPRAGCRDILPNLVKLGPERIIYVSCDPATLSRDLHYLHREGGYDVFETRCLDMFPQTYHLESLTLLKKR